MSVQGFCDICGEPMPNGEEMFKFHGYSGPCPQESGDAYKEAPLTLRAENEALRAEMQPLRLYAALVEEYGLSAFPELAALRADNDALDAKCDEYGTQYLALRAEVEALLFACERGRSCITGLLHRTPVRDVAETLAEMDAAIKAARTK